MSSAKANTQRSVPELLKGSSRWNRYASAGLLICLVFVVYCRIIGHEFVAWDDDYHVVENPYLREPSWQGLARFWERPRFGLYIPLSYTVFQAETLLGRAVSGESNNFHAATFHAVSVALHAACSILVFAVLRQLVSADWPAFAGAVTFALHPVQVESVAWISETRGLLSGFFSFLAISHFVTFARMHDQSTSAETTDVSARDPASPSDSGQLAWWCATVSYLLALLAKPVAVAVPIMAVIIDRTVTRRPLRSSIRSVAPWFVMAIGFVVLNKLEQRSSTIGVAVPVWQRFFIAGDAVAFYFQKLLLPTPLCIDYGRNPQSVMTSFAGFCSWLFPVTILAGLWRVRFLNGFRPALGLFLAGLFPMLGFISFAHQEISTVADRYLYLPMLGAALAVSTALSRFSERETPLPGGGASTFPMRVPVLAAFILLGILSFRQAGHWRDSTSLFGHTLDVTPQSFVACNNSGNEQLREGNVSAAIPLFRRALEIKPDYQQAHYNLGIALGHTDATQQAAEHLRRAVQMDPAHGQAHYDLGVVLNRLGDTDTAVLCYENVLRLQPDHSDAHNNLGVILADRGRLNAALDHFRTAVSSAPDRSELRINLADLLIVLGRQEEASEQYRTALRISPELHHAHTNLGRLYLKNAQPARAARHFQMALRLDAANADTHFDLALAQEQQEQWHRSCKSYLRVLRLDPTRTDAHLNLGNLFHRMGRPMDAIRHLQSALELDPGLAMAHNSLGRVYREQAAFTKAISHFERAITLSPEFAAARFNLGTTLLERGENEQAIRHLEAALSLVPAQSVAATDIRKAIKRSRRK